MKKQLLTTMLMFTFALTTVTQAETPPQMPAPEKEHAWLHQLAGEWDTTMEVFMEPGKPPITGKGTESGRMLGGFWLVANGTGDMMGSKFNSVLTVGYDPAKKKYIGSWVDSMSSYQWKYEGTLDPTGKILTMETEGPCPLAPGKLLKFKEVTEIKSKDHKVFTSNVQGEDGKWTKMVTVDFKRQAKHGH